MHGRASFFICASPRHTLGRLNRSKVRGPWASRLAARKSARSLAELAAVDASVTGHRSQQFAEQAFGPRVLSSERTQF
jgi:hypothetical protein